MIRWPIVTALIFTAQMVAAGAVPGDSLYQLRLTLLNQDAHETAFESFRGQPLLVSMFYASCPDVCPTTIANMKRIDRDAGSAGLRVLMISFDERHDTSETLLALANLHGVNTERWTFATVRGNDVRKIAAALGIKYRPLPDGQFNHSTRVSLLDREGRIVAQTSQILQVDPEFMREVSTYLGAEQPR